MDLKHTATATSSAAAATGSPDIESESPLHSQPIKPLSSFPNGKKHHYQPPPTAVAYKECLKNHAATIGSHALDGCGEFMPPPEPTSLKCAACGCHRNFHRRESANDFYATATATTKTHHFIEFHHTGGISTSPPPQPTNYAYAPHMLLSLSTAAADQTHTVTTPGTPAAIKIENPNGRKRFRTKFSQDQKEKMSLFAEKVGWKMQRCDDKMVADFCNEIGIRRGVLKVWMHNNKNTFGKKDKETTSPTTATNAAAIAAVGVCNKSINVYSNGRTLVSESHEDVNVDRLDNRNSSHQENGGGGGGGGCGGAVLLQASTNGSSSSS